MNPAIAKKGSSFKGAIAYITHDIGSESTERVAQTGTFNLRTNDPDKAARAMAWTAEHAFDLKAAAGLPTTGRKTVDPVYHFALTWEPSQQPSAAEMTQAAQSALETLGFAGHEAVYAIHTDKAHAHIHVVVNRINPETGRTVNPDKDYDRMQRWAWGYEKARGHIYCVDRALRFERDPGIRAELKHRQAIERERGNQAENKSRPEWQAEQDAPYPRSRLAHELRAELAAKAKALTVQKQNMTAQHRDERAALHQAYTAQKQALWDQQRTAYRAEAATALKHGIAELKGLHSAERDVQRTTHGQEQTALLNQYKDTERQAINRLFQSQRQEFRAFLETSHRQGWIGALATAIQAARSARPERERPSMRADLSRFVAAALSADKRVALYLQGQKTERDKLRTTLRRAHAPKRKHDLATLKDCQRQERHVLTTKHRHEREQRTTELRQALNVKGRATLAEGRNNLRAAYVVDRANLIERQQQERQQLKQAWAAHNAERRNAWANYREQRAQQTAEQKPTPFIAQARTRDTRAADQSRRANSGRSNKAQSKPTGRDHGPPRR